jgi:hypothetical protein
MGITYDLRAKGHAHDIALVELDAPLNGLTAERVLDPLEAAAVLRPGVRVELVGYGRTSADGWRLGEMNAAEATITSVGAYEMTIGRPRRAAELPGRLGGPAFLTVADGTRRLISIVSRSANDATDCDRQHPPYNRRGLQQSLKRNEATRPGDSIGNPLGLVKSRQDLGGRQSSNLTVP